MIPKNGRFPAKTGGLESLVHVYVCNANWNFYDLSREREGTK